MRKEKIEFELAVFENAEELPIEFKELLNKAEESREKAYAPYSNFQVGAAVLLENGEVVLGNNQENACYPAGLCAERVAIFHAAAEFPSIPIVAIAIASSSNKHKISKPAAPCGSCRQAIAEYEQKQKKPITLIFSGKVGDIFMCKSILDLLPIAFNNSFLSDS